MHELRNFCHSHGSGCHLAAEEDYALHVALIVLVRRDARRGLLDRGEVLEARDLIEPFLLGLGEHGLLDENRLGDAAASGERRVRQAQDAAPVNAAHRSTAKHTSE